ncbi:uncharacterized protein LOC144638918 [Oculina patagonica]
MNEKSKADFDLTEIDSILKVYSNSTQNKPDFQKSIDNINGWVNEQRKSKENKEREDNIAKVGAALKTTVNALKKFETGDPYDAACGTLEIISSVAAVAGGPCGVAFSALCSIAGAIISANKPAKPSVVEQLANVVHRALNDFHNKLQNAKLSGLKDRIEFQQLQLREMKKKKELEDTELWHDYNQFMGELISRVNNPLEFKYEKSLGQDPDLADFVRAVVTYCNAYTCFMALLTAVRGKYEEFDDSSDIVDTINQHITHRTTKIKETLTFLSDKKHLKFIGRLPSEGGKLTKILLLTRNPEAKKVVEATRRSLKLSEMPDSDEVEKAAEKVSRQSVQLKFDGKTFAEGLRGILTAVELLPLPIPIVIGSATTVLFINETDFPMRIVSGKVGWPKGNMEFQEDVKPHSYYDKVINSFTGTFSTGGYIKIAYDGKLSSKEDPNEGGAVKVIEFALSSPYVAQIKINIGDNKERTRGEGTYKSMTNDKGKTLYWKWPNAPDGKHYLARAEVLRSTVEGITDWIKLRKFNLLPYTSKAKGTWCFIIQDFDPEKDLVEEEE